VGWIGGKACRSLSSTDTHQTPEPPPHSRTRLKMKKSIRVAESSSSGGRNRKKKRGAGLMPSQSVSALLKWPAVFWSVAADGPGVTRCNESLRPNSVCFAAASSQLRLTAPHNRPQRARNTTINRTPTQVEGERQAGKRGAGQERPDGAQLVVQHGRRKHGDADEQQRVRAAVGDGAPVEVVWP